MSCLGNLANISSQMSRIHRYIRPNFVKFSRESHLLDLGAGEVVKLAHGAPGEEDDLAGEVGAARHPHRQVRMTVGVEMAEGEGVSQVGVVLALRPLLRRHQVQPVPEVLGVGLTLPVVATRRADEQALLKHGIWHFLIYSTVPRIVYFQRVKHLKTHIHMWHLSAG